MPSYAKVMGRGGLVTLRVPRYIFVDCRHFMAQIIERNGGVSVAMEGSRLCHIDCRRGPIRWVSHICRHINASSCIMNGTEYHGMVYPLVIKRGLLQDFPN